MQERQPQSDISMTQDVRLLVEMVSKFSKRGVTLNAKETEPIMINVGSTGASVELGEGSIMGAIENVTAPKLSR
jgi:hypothetical protein